MFKKVLVANRGEIAVRVMQTLKLHSIRAVAVYSNPDHDALHAATADEAYALSGSTSAETYLRGERIIEIAKQCKADAIHPGYGFLSENAAFAEACRNAGITFIGPNPNAMRSMGDKVAAKQAMTAANVPVVPGWNAPADATSDEFRGQAGKIGYPVLIKAAAGGGGKGMRLVHDEYELAGALEAASREAKAAFANGRVFLEKYIAKPRHVEFQIFGDEHGHVVHLNERECSIQRRYQKLIEESPSVAMTPELRREMGQAAVRAGQAIGYTNAGTVEFLLDANGKFYFLEVNARLQVEHPVTEMTTRQDLVALQLRVAAGEKLPFGPDGIPPQGHAIECRICAEDAANNFMPSIGRIHVFRPPSGANIRVDTGVTEGAQVTVHYDPMLAKLIVWGQDRPDAIARMRRALRDFAILGATHNIDFLERVLAHPAFQSGDLHTHFLEEHPIAAESAPKSDETAAIIAALAQQSGPRGVAMAGAAQTAIHPSPWSSTSWRML